MTCCKEKAVFVAIYEEKPRKKRLTTRSNDNIKHHHHHHHHYHHLQVHESKNGQGTNRRAELLSYSQHLRESSKLEASTSSHRPKTLVAPIIIVQQTKDPVLDVPKKQKLKKQSSWVHMNNLFKCFAMSQAKKRMKKKKKKSGDSSSKKASVIMKTFNARTQKGTNRFFKKLMATIQKYR